MASFFEKLIGGQDPDQSVKEKKTTLPKATKKPARPKLPPREQSEEEADYPAEQLETEKSRPPSESEAEPEEEIPEETEKPAKVERKKEWAEAEGQLAIDVYQTDGEVVIESTIGGVKPENLEITIENGMVLIRGNRQKIEAMEKNDYLIQECHWGSFSRQFVLPSEVDASRAEATLKDGILTIRIPRIQKEKVTKLLIK